MSIDIMSLVWKRYPEGGGELILALALADFAHDSGEHIFPAVETLAKKTRQSRRNVQYQLRRMEDSGWLEVVAHANGGRAKGKETGRPREYRINPDWIKGAEIASLQKGATGDTKGRNFEHERAQKTTSKGAIAVAPDPLKNHQEPSENHFVDRVAADCVPSPADKARPGKPTQPAAESKFERWWQTWPKSPRKVGKADCEKRWKRHNLDVHAEVIIAHTAAMKLSKQWKTGFDPAPATYLNQERWRDEVPPDESELQQGEDEGTSWWETASGWQKKGQSLGVQYDDKEPFAGYRIRVAKAAGAGPWIDFLLKDVQRFGADALQSLVQSLGERLMPVDWYA